LYFPGLCFLHQVQVFREEELEELFPAGFFPFFLIPEGLEVYRVVLLSVSEVSISISHCFTLAYDKLSLVVRLSIMFLWCITKKPIKKSCLALSSLRKAAKVVQYESEDPFESLVPRSHWDSNLDVKSDRLLQEYWVGRETRFII